MMGLFTIVQCLCSYEVESCSHILCKLLRLKVMHLNHLFTFYFLLFSFSVANLLYDHIYSAIVELLLLSFKCAY